MNNEPPLSKEEADARFQSVLDKLDELNRTWSRGFSLIWLILIIFTYFYSLH